MSTNAPETPAAVTSTAEAANNLFAAVDMGTNSFKLLIVRADPSNGRFLTLDHLKEPVLLGLDSVSTISPASQTRALAALRKFQKILHAYHIPPSNSRLIATSAVREASNQSEFLHRLHQTLNLHIDVLSGLDEARLIYLGVLEFHPVVNQIVLTVDIGGGSTEFVVGNNGSVLYATSLRLGHVTLTGKFIEIMEMRKHIRSVIESSGLIEKVKEYRVDKVIGSSGTIRAIEKAVAESYSSNLVENVGVIEGSNRDWRFSKEELRELLERLEREGKERRERFFKKRAGFIVAGAVLLEEIFKEVGIQEMEVSGYALGEGVISEMLGKVFRGFYGLNANERWRSVVRLAMRFNSKKRMKSAAICAGMAKEIFEGIRKWNEVDNELPVHCEDHDLEYLEAASLLHNIGLYAGKKGYHKLSYRILTNGNPLQGYNSEEVKIIGLLVKHHRKKFPKWDHDSQMEQVKVKLGMLCAILRVSAAVLQFLSATIPKFEFSHSCEGFKLVLGQGTNYPPLPATFRPLVGNHTEELDKELEHFRMVFQKKLSVVVL